MIKQPPDNGNGNTKLLWYITRPIIGVLVSALIALAGWFGVRQDTRITELEQTTVNDRIVFLEKLAELSVRNTADHAEIKTKLDMLVEKQKR